MAHHLYINEIEQRTILDLLKNHLAHLQEDALRIARMGSANALGEAMRQDAIEQRTAQIRALAHLINKVKQNLPEKATVTGIWEQHKSPA